MTIDRVRESHRGALVSAQVQRGFNQLKLHQQKPAVLIAYKIATRIYGLRVDDRDYFARYSDELCGRLDTQDVCTVFFLNTKIAARRFFENRVTVRTGKKEQ